MSRPQLDEEAIIEVARAIQKPTIRAKYLRQVCGDEKLLARLEGRLSSGAGRWQFSLRTLLVTMLVGGVLSAGIAALGLQAARVRRAEEMARRRALEAQRMADIARERVEAARLRAALDGAGQETE